MKKPLSYLLLSALAIASTLLACASLALSSATLAQTAPAARVVDLKAADGTSLQATYYALHDAPWIWYETSDATKVAAHGAHGTDLFQTHPELAAIVQQWLVDTLIVTPGLAPADPLAASQILNDVQFNGGAARARQQLLEARKHNPKAQLWPEISMSIVAQDFLRVHDPKASIEAYQLNELAYPDSADVADNLADAYLADGQKELARRYAERSLRLLDTAGMPASSWVNTEPYRAEIRADASKVLKKP